MKALTPLRGLAALAVLALHAGLSFRGYLGVDLFFLLSGFVMTHAYGAMAASAGAWFEFLKARLARIYPVHLLVLILLLPELGTSPAFSTGGLVSSLLLLQSPWHSMCWNFSAWSISAEWHAYLVFPALAVGLRTKPAGVLLRILAGCLLVVGITSWLDHSGNITNSPVVLLRCLPEFIAGMALYRLRALGRLPAWIQSDAAFAAAVAALLGLEIVKAPEGFSVCALAILLLCAARDGSAFARALGWPPLRWLGEISYSLYMVQMAVVVALARFWPHLAGWPLALAFCAGSLTLAAPISRWIEYPARGFLRSLRLKPPVETRAARYEGYDSGY